MDHNMVCEATLVSWLLPSQDLVAMNVDGRVLGDPSRLGFGGLGWDSVGNFLFGFYGNMGHASILHGLEVCWNQGCCKLICYSDSKTLTYLLQRDIPFYHRYGNELLEIKR